MFSQRHIAWIRVAVGLAQGVGLYLLFRATSMMAWPATDPAIFASLLLVTVFVPVVIIAGLGNLTARALAVRALVTAVICAGLAVYDIFRDPLDSGAGL